MGVGRTGIGPTGADQVGVDGDRSSPVVIRFTHLGAAVSPASPPAPGGFTAEWEREEPG
jgi:hypothetical protein